MWKKFEKDSSKCPLPVDWIHQVLKRIPLTNGNVGISYLKESVRVAGDSCLDPRVVTVKSLIEQGIIIQPGDVRNLFTDTDVANMEVGSEENNLKILNYLEENRDKLSLMKRVDEKVEIIENQES